MRSWMRRRALVVLAGLAAICMLQTPAQAEYPDRPIRWIVGYTPGGTSDFLARMVAKEMQKDIGTQVLVDNRPGASGVIAAGLAHEAPADGYTVVLESDGYFNTITLGTKPNFDPLDFDFLAQIALVPDVVVVPVASKIHTAADLIVAAKAAPGQLQFGSGGVGTGTHISAELFAANTGIKMQHIPYKGAKEAILDLVAGRLDVMFASSDLAFPMISAKKIRPVAVTSAQSVPLLPGVAPIAETVSGFDHETYYIVMAPKGMPKDVRDRLLAAFHKALASDTVKAEIGKLGMHPALLSPEDTLAKLQKEISEVKEVAKGANISLKAN